MYQGRAGNKNWPWGEIGNLARFWANNKLFISFRPTFIQAVQIFDRDRPPVTLASMPLIYNWKRHYAVTTQHGWENRNNYEVGLSEK